MRVNLGAGNVMEAQAPVVYLVDDDDDGLLFISRFRLRPLMGTRQERPGAHPR